MDDILLQSELEAKRIRNGLCPRCGYVVSKHGEFAESETGKTVFLYRYVKCTKCDFTVDTNDVWDEREGFCIVRK